MNSWQTQKTAAVRTQLDQDTFNKAWAAGQSMSLEEAVAFALDEETG